MSETSRQTVETTLRHILKASLLAKLIVEDTLGSFIFILILTKEGSF